MRVSIHILPFSSMYTYILLSSYFRKYSFKNLHFIRGIRGMDMIFTGYIVNWIIRITAIYSVF